MVPAGLDTLTEAQQALVDLWEVPQELLVAAAQHSSAAAPTVADDFVAWIELLPQDRRSDYLVRLTHNEPGLSHLLVRELRGLRPDKTAAKPPRGERVPYTTLLAESEEIAVRLENEQREQAQKAHLSRLQEAHDHQEEYWRQIEAAVTRATGTSYDEATRLLVEQREASEHFLEIIEFQTRFRSWIQSHTRRPALLKRLKDLDFVWPEPLRR